MADEKQRFRTHSGYLRAFATLAGLASSAASGREALEDLDKRLHLLPRAPQAPKTVDLTALERSLSNAWGTELLVAVALQQAKSSELLRLASTWAVIQTYYVSYYATQAVAVARGFPRPDSHPKTQKQFVSFWVDRPLDCAPWSLGAASDGFRNVPTGVDVREIHGWSWCNEENYWSLALQALRTTRKAAVEKALDRLREEKIREARRTAGRELKRGRLSKEEKTKADEQTRTYAMIDYLYRLRLNVNYDDLRLFAKGPQDDDESRAVFRDCRYLAASTMLMAEHEVAARVGRPATSRWMHDWAKSNVPPGSKMGVAFRSTLFK